MAMIQVGEPIGRVAELLGRRAFVETVKRIPHSGYVEPWAYLRASRLLAAAGHMLGARAVLRLRSESILQRDLARLAREVHDGEE
jgi:hypothetical protein